jgi:hypothetical protein
MVQRPSTLNDLENVGHSEVTFQERAEVARIHFQVGPRPAEYWQCPTLAGRSSTSLRAFTDFMAHITYGKCRDGIWTYRRARRTTPIRGNLTLLIYLSIYLVHGQQHQREQDDINWGTGVVRIQLRVVSRFRKSLAISARIQRDIYGTYDL